MTVRQAETDADIQRCFPVMAELRPQLAEADWLPRVRRQMEQGYRLAFVEDAGSVQAVAGYRFGECLAWGRYLYVDDLVTAAKGRSQGYGAALLNWLLAHAREARCDELHLDSGVQRFDAHRFYLRERMNLTSHHFAIRV